MPSDNDSVAERVASEIERLNHDSVDVRMAANIAKQALVAVEAERNWLREELGKIKAVSQADADDLAQMRDGTKLTRAGVVDALAYSIEENDALRTELTALREVLRQLRNDPDSEAAKGIADAALSPAESKEFECCACGRDKLNAVGLCEWCCNRATA